MTTLGECLRAAAVRRVFGDTEVPGLPFHRVDEPWLARLLADADGRTLGGNGAALVGRRLRVSAAPGVAAEVEPAAALGMPVSAERLWVPSAREFDLDDGPPPDGPGGFAHTLEQRLPPEVEAVVMAGPGVVRAGAVVDLHALVAATGWGVLNTWGAKGLFRWDDRHHLGTAGLQQRDGELAELRYADALVAVGLDPNEGADLITVDRPVTHLRPVDLAGAAARWGGPHHEPIRPPLYAVLAAVVGRLYDQPGSPAWAAAQLAARLPAGGLVAADPGPAGFWVARAFPTTEPGSVVVPATVARGFAAAAALVAGLDGRPAVAVTTAPGDDETRAVVDLAAAWDVPLTLEVWGEDPAVDFSLTRLLVDIAGPVIAWGSS